jgi:hypothetical protein
MAGNGGYYPDSKITGPSGAYLVVNADGSINALTTGASGSNTTSPKYAAITSASSARTASGNTGSIALTGTPRALAITISITAVSGTSPTLQWFAQTSDANGILTDIFPRIIAGTPVAGTQLRFMFAPEAPLVTHALPTATNVLGLGSAPCIFNPADSILLGWVIGGTTPSITFQYGIQQLY